MPSATLASTGDGATVPIHTTMAQPLLFSNSGRNVEPIRRRMARRGMRVASEAYTVPMQQPMPRLNKELGHKVVDKESQWGSREYQTDFELCHDPSQGAPWCAATRYQ
ncbi:unnamed protein product [Fusarium graminearum]|nr:unnamed protein product [Fusarium graminearum]